jgi:hypothetical protein
MDETLARADQKWTEKKQRNEVRDAKARTGERAKEPVPSKETEKKQRKFGGRQELNQERITARGRRLTWKRDEVRTM